jgi:integrase
MYAVRGFTDRFLAALKPRANRYDVCDPSRRGLTVRVFPSGTKTFVFRYRRGGRLIRITMGNYPAVSLREAYEAHAGYVKRLHRGESPKAPGGPHPDPSDVRAKPPETTVGDLAAEFLRRYVYVERKRPEEAEQAIEANILKHWRHRPARTVTRRDAVLLLDKIVDRGSPVMANRTAALLSQMFRFGVERGILEGSPLIALPRPGGTEKPRERYLSEREIRQFWRRLAIAPMSAQVRLGLKLILVTGQRPGEVAGAARSEFDLENALWTIPADRSKNGKPHQVPISGLAMTLLAHLERVTGDTPNILPSPRWREHTATAIDALALARGIRRNEQHFAISRFTPHDLRRTAASMMTATGTPRLHVEKVLNHTISDVAEVYDRHDYLEEKRAALDRWAATLWELLNRGSSTVVPIRNARTAVVDTLPRAHRAPVNRESKLG